MLFAHKLETLSVEQNTNITWKHKNVELLERIGRRLSFRIFTIA